MGLDRSIGVIAPGGAIQSGDFKVERVDSDPTNSTMQAGPGRAEFIELVGVILALEVLRLVYWVYWMLWPRVRINPTKPTS